MGRAVLVKLMAKNGPIIFFDHSKFEIQNNFGSIFCENLLHTKIGFSQVWSVGRQILILIFDFRPKLQFSHLYLVKWQR